MRLHKRSAVLRQAELLDDSEDFSSRSRYFSASHHGALLAVPGEHSVRRLPDLRVLDGAERQHGGV